MSITSAMYTAAQKWALAKATQKVGTALARKKSKAKSRTKAKSRSKASGLKAVKVTAKKGGVRLKKGSAAAKAWGKAMRAKRKKAAKKK